MEARLRFWENDLHVNTWCEAGAANMGRNFNQRIVVASKFKPTNVETTVHVFNSPINKSEATEGTESGTTKSLKAAIKCARHNEEFCHITRHRQDE